MHGTSPHIRLIASCAFCCIAVTCRGFGPRDFHLGIDVPGRRMSGSATSTGESAGSGDASGSNRGGGGCGGTVTGGGTATDEGSRTAATAGRGVQQAPQTYYAQSTSAPTTPAPTLSPPGVYRLQIVATVVVSFVLARVLYHQHQSRTFNINWVHP